MAKRQEKGICSTVKKNVAHLTQRRALRTMIIASAESSKSPFVQTKFTRTLCIWKTHVPNNRNNANFIPTIRGECATHRNCSRLFQTSLQRNVGSCRDGEFHDG